MQQGEVDRPQEAAHAIATHQSARQQHILGADQHHILLRVLGPGLEIGFSAHQYMDGHPIISGFPKNLKPIRAEPLLQGLSGLFYQDPHR